MLRIEIFANRAVSPLLEEALGRLGLDQWTLVKDASGSGYKGLALGDTIWPELNDIFVLYADENVRGPLKEALELIRESFPIQGLAAFVVPVAEVL